MQAIVLAAGLGSRLQARGPAKPLVEVAGRPLLQHVLERLAAAGIHEAVVAVGFLAEEIERAAFRWDLSLDVRFVRIADPSAPNGASALAAAPHVSGRTLLVMSDHLVEPALYVCVKAAGAEPGMLWLGVDRRLGHPWVDHDDVTRVRTEGDAIVAIGKGLPDYNGFDTGVFSVDVALFDALSAIPAPSLSQGVAALAARGAARAIETGDAAWLDVDDPRAHDLAETWFADMRRKVSA
jgi:1L-myo-inositol 1-phosphate cytidylyltransferase